MSIDFPRTTKTHKPEYSRRSLIKPHLLNFSSSGSMLNGAIVERNLEQPNSEPGSASVKASKHVIVVHAGSSANLEWKIDGRQKSSLFLEGDAIVNPAGFFAAPRWSSKVEILLLAIDPVFISRIAAEMNRQDGLELIPHFQFRDELLLQLIRGSIAEFEQDIPPDLIYAESLIHTSIAHLIRRYSFARSKPQSTSGGLSPRRLALVIDYINDQIDTTLSLAAIAKIAEISPSYFISRFKQSTGLTPHQYVMAQRLEKARTLLTQTKLPIAEVANQTGFADQSHLTRLMRRHTGLTPKILRGD